MIRTVTIQVIKILALFSVVIFSVLMLKTIFQYTAFEKNTGFLAFKQQVIGNRYWITCFYIHIFSILLCFLAGLTQFSNRFLAENKKLHRIIGKIYIYNILIINVPVCFILGLFSNGGLIGIAGFLTQDVLWAYFTIIAVLSIKKGDTIKHKNYMMLSYAVTTTAITFRIIKNLFYNEGRYHYDLFYGINVWLALGINLLIAYLVLKRNMKHPSLALKKNMRQENKQCNIQ
ncbi:DUF2306 domain-containing protein [Chryseobacterium sp.]|uniref:DUF2306 domain-containing protein n=1 Tax=Chryseobacterium sp. TaxID=1871047 RepID=UPI0025C06F9C|nr:DUF2306 domain-containing protein [Chryseobacterium sp.]MBV8327681.1 DUF2306 domain-containing protein [Chryseobacterium sp.]